MATPIDDDPLPIYSKEDLDVTTSFPFHFEDLPYGGIYALHNEGKNDSRRYETALALVVMTFYSVHLIWFHVLLSRCLNHYHLLCVLNRYGMIFLAMGDVLCIYSIESLDRRLPEEANAGKHDYNYQRFLSVMKGNLSESHMQF